jgi:purine-nucleoside phosphorylase
VYGASVLLEALQILRDGGTKEVFFIGSLYARDLPIGTLVTPSKAIDQAGIVLLDDPRAVEIRAGASEVRRLRSALNEANLRYREMEVVSVPAVLHDIAHIREFLSERTEAGVEMEVSTFYHFARKLELQAYALLYVSDNENYDVISEAEVVQRAKRRGMRQATRVAVKLLGGDRA